MKVASLETVVITSRVDVVVSTVKDGTVNAVEGFPAGSVTIIVIASCVV